ncbi:AraC family transcriptional regulator [Paenibacillus sp. y28]|uniref:AraC family transcriptional regulator n=1 Tax=Paenibacillus sp. y28 TaxID=3129110 RepID=UPI0030177257
MQHKLHDARQLASYYYRLDKITYTDSGRAMFQPSPSLYTLLLFMEAGGEMIIGGQAYPLRPQKMFLFPPHIEALFSIPAEYPVTYYELRFQALEAAAEGQFLPAKLDQPYEIVATHVQFLLKLAHEIDDKHKSADPWDKMQANIVFQEMIVALFKEAGNERKLDADQAIASTIRYMEQNYASAVTREKLAELAGMSADYYSKLFKKKIGKSPMEHLNDIRIRHAKQALISSRNSFRHIAGSVGFSDEFYFSRKFKAATGISPTNYIKKIKYSDRIASLKHGLTGHLMVLGIEPYAALVNEVYPITTELRNTITVGDSRPDLEKLITAKPDLIVTGESRDYGKSQKEKLFEQIAPTMTLAFFDTWRTHLQSIARLVGKEREADLWLESYELAAEKRREQLHRRLEGDTILVLAIGEGKLCVFGQRNIGSVLYGDLQLGVPKGVENIPHYKEIRIEQLADFQADRILLTNFRNDGSPQVRQAIQRERSRLISHEVWQDLRAVRSGTVHTIFERQHLYTSYNSLSNRLLMDRAYKLLMTDSSKQ